MPQQTARGQKQLRKGRVSIPGQIYHIIFVTRMRRPILAEFSTARTVIASLRACEPEASTLAFVVMPDHVHWLFSLNATCPLHRIVAKAKALSSRGCRGGKVWQRGFYDRALRREEDLQGVARYIVMNPVRAGLVTKVGLYPHWDAVWL